MLNIHFSPYNQLMESNTMSHFFFFLSLVCLTLFSYQRMWTKHNVRFEPEFCKMQHNHGPLVANTTNNLKSINLPYPSGYPKSNPVEYILALLWLQIPANTNMIKQIKRSTSSNSKTIIQTPPCKLKIKDPNSILAITANQTWLHDKWLPSTNSSIIQKPLIHAIQTPQTSNKHSTIYIKRPKHIYVFFH